MWEDIRLEYTIRRVKAYESGKPDSLIVVIPKTVCRMLVLARGSEFEVKVDSVGRIIYEPIAKKSSNKAATIPSVPSSRVLRRLQRE